MGRWVLRSGSVLHTLSSSSKGQFRSVRIKIKMSNTFFFVTPVKCFTLLRSTYLLSRALIANSSTPSPGVMGQVLPRFSDKAIRVTRNVEFAPVLAKAGLVSCSKRCLSQQPSGFFPPWLVILHLWHRELREAVISCIVAKISSLVRSCR